MNKTKDSASINLKRVKSHVKFSFCNDYRKVLKAWISKERVQILNVWSFPSSKLSYN